MRALHCPLVLEFQSIFGSIFENKGYMHSSLGIMDERVSMRDFACISLCIDSLLFVLTGRLSALAVDLFVRDGREGDCLNGFHASRSNRFSAFRSNIICKHFCTPYGGGRSDSVRRGVGGTNNSVHPVRNRSGTLKLFAQNSFYWIFRQGMYRVVTRE